MCPDLTILDIIMPKLDGLYICRLLKSDPSLCTVPVIVMTAYVYSGYEEASHEAGADAFIRKPFEEAELPAIVRRVLPGSTQ
jgi:two-component system alkaline phosphatase synthesis response regulator PhoP